MIFLNKLSLALPEEISLEDLKALVSAESWQKNPENAAIQALQRCGKFNTEAYLARYPDVSSAGIDPIKHFVYYGINEGRAISDTDYSQCKRIYSKLEQKTLFQRFDDIIQNRLSNNLNNNANFFDDYITENNLPNIIISELIDQGFNFWIVDCDDPDTLRIGIKYEVKNSVVGYLSKVKFENYDIDIKNKSTYLCEFNIVDKFTNRILKSPKIQLDFWLANDKYIYTENYNHNIKRIPKKYREKTIYAINLPWLRQDRYKEFSLYKRLNSKKSILLKYNYPVDIVYLWVDGSDKKFIEKKSRYKNINEHNLDDHKIRYRNNDELKYSLRSVASFFKYYRKIFIVSDRQKPTWLKKENNIIFINHDEIIEPKFLPIYNSNAIECYIHKIKNLSEQFIYFNDDFMLGKPCSIGDFFYPNGIVKCFMAKEGFYNYHDPNEESCANAAHYNSKLIEKIYGDTLYTRNAHVPQGYIKSVLQYMQDCFKNEYHRTLRNRFRKNNDVIPTAYLFNYFAIKMNKGVPVELVNDAIITSKSNKKIISDLAKINDEQIKFYCINDGECTEEIDEAVRNFYITKYPIKSDWEI